MAISYGGKEEIEREKLGQSRKHENRKHETEEMNRRKGTTATVFFAASPVGERSEKAKDEMNLGSPTVPIRVQRRLIPGLITY
jgi:hypothetical protein